MVKRRNFLKKCTAILPATLLPGLINTKVYGAKKFTENYNLKLGIASYSFRNYSLEETIAMTKVLHIKYLALKSMHMQLDLSDAELEKTAGMVTGEDVSLYGAGVIYMNNEKEVENAFRYANAAGIKVIIGVPKHNLLRLVEKKVKATGIKVAIHNHGPGDKLYPSPESIYEKIKDLDPGLGICLDIGHTERIGLNAAEQAEKYFDRLLDIHIKDVSAATEKGTTVTIGQGIIDIPAFIKVLINNKYDGVVSFEYEKDPDDIMPGIAESIGYVRGVIGTLQK